MKDNIAWLALVVLPGCSVLLNMYKDYGSLTTTNSILFLAVSLAAFYMYRRG